MQALLFSVLFALSACSAVSDTKTLLAERDAQAAVADDSDSPAADCLTPGISESPKNGSELWLRALDGEGALDTASVASDRFGNAYVTLAGGGTSKFSPSGDLIWSRPYGVLVAVGANDAPIVAGSFREAFEADGVPIVGAGGSDVYVLTLDSAGNVERSTVLGGAGDELLSGLTTASGGRIVVSGSGLGTLMLEPGGAIAWQRSFAGAVAVDPVDNVLVTGSFEGTQDFGGGPLTSAGGRDIFLAKLGPDGEALYSARFGDSGANQEGTAVASDFLGNILVAGLFDGSVDFGAGPLTLARCPAEVWCKQAGFVAKLDANGSVLFSVARGPLRALGGLATDGNGSIAFSGATPGGVPSYRIPLLVVLDAEGKELREKSEWPASGVGSGRALAGDPCGNWLWSISARPNLDSGERAYLAKLAP